MMDADRLLTFDPYSLDLANERLLHDGDVVPPGDPPRAGRRLRAAARALLWRSSEGTDAGSRRRRRTRRASLRRLACTDRIDPGCSRRRSEAESLKELVTEGRRDGW